MAEDDPSQAELIAHYRDLFDAVSDALFIHDERGAILDVNAPMCRMFACTREQALSCSIEQLSDGTPPYSAAEAGQYVARAIAEGECTFEWRSRRLGDGALFWSEVALKPGRLGGRPRLIACVRDITRRKVAEESLGESEHRFTRIFNSATNPMAFSDPVTGELIAVNDAWVELSGVPREEALGSTATALGLWPSPEARQATMAALAEQGQLREHQLTLAMRTGPRVCAASAESLTIDGKDYLLWEFRDLTGLLAAEKEREKLRAQLLQAQKMESLGRLTGGIAHDFNNLLTVINGSADLMAHFSELDPEASAELQEIRAAGERAAALTRQLLAFSRQQVLQPRVVDLNQTVGATTRLLERLIGENVKLSMHLDPELHRVLADPDQIGQVILNLAVNARDAMPRGGQLTIETQNTRARPPLSGPEEDTVDSGQPLADYVCLSVSDTGIGMDAATQTRLFEPFFTTKPVGQGTGLGLSTAYGIVKQTGGFISVYSEPSVGSTFRVYLPCAEPISEVHAAELKVSRGSGTVLVVEDQASVRRITSRMLAAQGYQVLEAAGAKEALEMVKSGRQHIDVLVTDVIMPDVSGPQLYRELLALLPDLPCLFISGYAANAIVEHDMLDDGLHFLQKPFSSATLSQKLEQVLSSRSADATAGDSRADRDAPGTSSAAESPSR